jgi:ELWxxDGT repeat protein
MKTLFIYTTRLLLLLLLFTSKAYTQQNLTMVKDINPGAGHAFLGSGALVFFWQIGNKAMIPATNGTGYELWMSDGTTDGTFMLKDLAPTGNLSVSAANMAYLGNDMIFSGNGNLMGTGSAQHLVRTDGTTAGTVPYLKLDGLITGYGVTPSGMYTLNNSTILFPLTASSGNNSALWKTDGTAAGTMEVKDINPGTSDNIQVPVVLNNTLYFSASDGTSGGELWRSDGTAAGTFMVKDINPGAGSGYNSNIQPVIAGNLLFFLADDGNGSEVWRSDGTPAGTFMVKDIDKVPGTGSGIYYGSLIAVGNEVFFYADDDVNGLELWKTDGTAAGTVMVKDITPGSASTTFSTSNNKAGVDSVFYFAANDGVNGEELWISDGTTAGTVMVKDINPGSGGGGIGYNSMKGYNRQVFFTANDSINGSELWVSNGTAAGTHMVKDIVPGADGATISNMSGAGNWLFFLRKAPITNVQELWKTDGTAGGTVPVYTESTVNLFTVVNNVIYANVSSPANGRELYTGNANAMLDQAITFDSLPRKTYGDTAFTLPASASSGLPLIFTSSDETIAKIVNDTMVQILGAGTVTITARQPGNVAWNPADTSQVLTIGKAPLTITAVDKRKVQYTANPPLEVTYTGFVNGDDAQDLSTPVSITTIVDDNTAPGEYDIVPADATSANYTITFVNGTMLVTEAPPQQQTITFPDLITKTVQDADFAPGATATSGLTVTYTSSNAAVATIVNNQVHITGAGTTVITAIQTGNNRWEAAAPVPQTLLVTKIPQTITFNALPEKHYGDEPLDPAAIASSGLPVTYTSDNAAVAVIENGIIRITGIGTVVITASQQGNATYDVAAAVTQVLTVGRRRLVITADDKTKQQGQLNPIFTCTITGFADGDNIRAFTSPVVFSTDAAQASMPGEYVINVSGAASPNYDIGFVSGMLTVTPAHVSESRLDAWFPAPSSLQVNIDVNDPQAAVLQLMDISGRLLVTEKLNLVSGRNTYTLPAANLVSGAYLLKVSGSGLQLTKKMLKR